MKINGISQMSRLRRASIAVLVVTVSCFLSACSDCQEAPSGGGISSSVTCYDVFDSKYKACYGPRWNEPVRKWCTVYDGYVVSLERVMANGHRRVVGSQDIDYRAPLASIGIHTDPKLHFVREASREVCFAVSEPEICFKAIDDKVKSSLPKSANEDPVKIAARMREAIDQISRTATAEGSTVGEQLDLFAIPESHEAYPWASRAHNGGLKVERMILVRGEAVTLQWFISAENTVTPEGNITESFMLNGVL